jgi:hypothetical protein
LPRIGAGVRVRSSSRIGAKAHPQKRNRSADRGDDRRSAADRAGVSLAEALQNLDFETPLKRFR